MKYQACTARARDRMWQCYAMHDANGAGCPMRHASSSASSSGSDACERARSAACFTCCCCSSPFPALLANVVGDAGQGGTARERHRAYLRTCGITGWLECVRWRVPSSAAGATSAGVAQVVVGGALLVMQQAAGSSYGGQLCLRRCTPGIARLLAARIDVEAGIGVEVGGGRGGLRDADGGL